MSSPVTVVPMLAPMMIQTAWFRVIMPALTKPTTMTVVAEEDWMTAVMAAPTSTPKNRLAVRRSRICFIRLPAAASRPELIICMPYKNRARPPNRLKKSVICINLKSSLSLVSLSFLNSCGRPRPLLRRSGGRNGARSAGVSVPGFAGKYKKAQPAALFFNRSAGHASVVL